MLAGHYRELDTLSKASTLDHLLDDLVWRPMSTRSSTPRKLRSAVRRMKQMTCVSENACSDDHTPPVRRKLLLCHATSFILLCLCVLVWRSASPAPDMRSTFSIPTSSSRRLDMSTHIPFPIFLIHSLILIEKKLLA